MLHLPEIYPLRWRALPIFGFSKPHPAGKLPHMTLPRLAATALLALAAVLLAWTAYAWWRYG